MQTFHMVRASQARPFLQHLEKAGADIEQLALDTGLPFSAVREHPEGVIGEYALWQFIERGAAQTGNSLLGYECAQAYPLAPGHQLGDLPIRLGSSLEKTLENFSADVLHLSTASYYSLDRRSGECWLRRAQAFGIERASWQVELYTVATLLQVIRLHAGNNWLPPALRFSSAASALPVPPLWNTIPMEWGAVATGILLSDEALSLPPQPGLTLHTRTARAPAKPGFNQLVATQVNAARIGAGPAATQLGISLSTLQRHLKASGTTYQDCLEQVRYGMACELLQNTAMSVAGIADTLGYTHIGNFTRAFTRWAGRPPSHYRD
ncbi:MAG: helix-turn-helix domain-containing protein [Halioglobus sp.]